MGDQGSIDQKFHDCNAYTLIPITFEKGDEVQKLSVVQSLPQLINLDAKSALTRVLPKIQQELCHSSCEFQVTTSQIFQILISSNYAAEGTITATLLQSLDSKDPIVASAWLETLLQVILILPVKTVQTEVLPLAVVKGQCSQSMVSRVASCRILGKVSIHPQIKAIDIKKDILPLVYGLCQDINYNVRAAICEQIPAIVQGLGCIQSKNLVLPNLVELSQDDNLNVRAIAVSSVVNCLPYLDKDTKTNTMCPLLMQLCQMSVKEETFASLALARDMGLMLTCMDGCVNVADTEVLIRYYLDLANRGINIKKYHYQDQDTSQDVLCRQNCASNLPAVASFIVNNSERQIDRLYDVFKTLSSDSCYMVRQTVAGILHEVARILGKQNGIMKPDFVRLLRDETEEVLQMLVPHLSRTFELFVYSGTLCIDRVAPAAFDIGKALLKCMGQLKKGFNWRLLTMFLKQLEYLPKCFRSEYIHNDFTPAVVQCAVKGGTKPVRIQAVRTLLVFLRWNTRQVQRTWLREHLITELAESRCSYTRHIFIQMCINAIEIFSNKYFKEYFFYPLLVLADDSVSTVRYCMVSLIPTLRKMIRLPVDRRLLQSLEHVILQLEKNEKDRDVLMNLIKRSKEMMAPFMPTSQDDYEANQRRLIEEEDQILKGKIVFQNPKVESINMRKDSITIERNRSNTKSISRSQSVSRQSSTKNSISIMNGRSTSVPRSPQQPTRPPLPIINTNREIISDMSILNQHFYIDAGVHLPMEEINVVETASLASPTENDAVIDTATEDISVASDANLESLLSVESSLSTLNITDDVKVNLRNMSKKNVNRNKRYSHSEIPTAIASDSPRNKRHSSIHTSADYGAGASRMNKRRSLNILPREMSKIPVVSKSVENADEARGSKSVRKAQEEGASSRKLSNLPVPVRRKQM